MAIYNCLIVEDEPLAAEVLEDYIKLVPYLFLKGVCTDAIFAMERLKNEKIDLIFLDIHLPKLKGLDFIRMLNNDKPKIILTTAYHEYALEGYSYGVLDYLLKPIEFSRFMLAVNKLKTNEYPEDKHTVSLPPPERKSIFFNVNKKMVRIFLDEIIYIESQKEYIGIVYDNGKIVTRFHLGEIEDLILHDFIRTHRSFIVAKSRITAFTATNVEINETHIPIGRSYKEQVYKVLETA